MYAHVNGVKLFFDIDGSGYIPDGPKMKHRSACIVLHGGPGSDHSDFKPWFDPLTEHMQLIYLDHRANGQSERVDPATCTLEQLADDIDAFRKYLGLDKVHVLGHSFGGMVAQTYAIKYPSSVEKLLLICTAPSKDFYEDAKSFAKKIATPRQLELIPRLFEGKIQGDEELEAWWDECFALYFYKKDEQLMYETGNRPIGSLEVCNYTFKHFMPHYDVRAQLPKLTMPVLIVAGRHDWITPVSQAEEMKGLLPDAILSIFEKSGHMPFIEEQESFIRTVVDFVDKGNK
ncbi:alpha/beta hydrolase [Siminovitchia terrae]|uniref:Alpha/beta hydrolase n=1 Tax=Siminovitchia terrae TaxID=1914933 RepID=A0A429X8N2_SIMTE|nr:alpha/beta hydrolase [Siminovitchia terrae]RST59746.1 alpha/beta hydrolase [Siminovitchia terrae]